MKHLAAILLIATGTAYLAAAQRRPQPAAPVFEGKSTLLLPADYREWVFVGSSIGLSYAANPPAQSAAAGGMRRMYHNVYMKPEAYREFAKTGKFPEGTVLAMEMASEDAKQEPGLQGSYEKEFLGLEVSVKDSSRFPAPGWAYFSFSNGAGAPYKTKAEPFPASAGCVSCHQQNAATDNVFTQFYPVLRAAKPK